MNNKKFDDSDTPEVLLIAVNAKLTASNTQLVENNENECL
jgi:hypothetical protein